MKPAIAPHALFEPEPDPNRLIARIARLLDEGPWSEHEQPDIIETLIVLSLGHTNAGTAKLVTRTTGRLRGPGYVRSVKERAARTLRRDRVEAVAS